MPAIPVVHCRNVQESLPFYTRILDFERKYREARDTDWVIDLIRHDMGHDVGDDAEIQLSQHAGDGAFGCAINIRVHDVDALFAKYLSRGLDTSGHDNSRSTAPPPIRHGASASSTSPTPMAIPSGSAKRLHRKGKYGTAISQNQDSAPRK